MEAGKQQRREAREEGRKEGEKELSWGMESTVFTNSDSVQCTAEYD